MVNKRVLTNVGQRLSLQRMQAQLDAISSVEPNVEQRLDRLFDRIGALYGGDYRAYFKDLDAANAENIIEEPDLKILSEISACRFNDD